MTSWGSVDFEPLKKWSREIDKALLDNAAREMTEQTLLEMGNRLLRRVKQKTPVGKGRLRNNWFLSDISWHGDTAEIVIYNNTEYAEAVEYGHRQEVGRYVPALGKRLKQPFVAGQYMLTLSMQEMEELTPRLIRQREEEFLRRLTGD